MLLLVVIYFKKLRFAIYCMWSEVLQAFVAVFSYFNDCGFYSYSEI